MTFSFTDKDKGWAKVMQEVAKLKAQPAVKVGVVGDKPDEALEAAVHEYGSPKNGIPERPFIGPTFDAEQGKVAAMMGKGLAGILDGTTTEKAVLSGIGESLTKSAKARMEAGISPPLKDGSGRTPLVKTGRLLEALSFEMVPTSKGVK